MDETNELPVMLYLVLKQVKAKLDLSINQWLEIDAG